MRSIAALILVALFVVALQPAQAQGTYSQGVYEFETASVGTTGTWTSGAIESAQSVRTSTVGGTVTFFATGNSIAITRLVRSAVSGTQTMSVCIAGLCSSVSNSATDITWQSIVFALPSGVSSVVITNTAGTLTLDYFMVLASPSSSFPTAVPTATILPSSTPASTTTPQPTPTPQPTSTPAPTSTPLLYVWAIDPARRYGDTNGQISAFDYSASAADVHIANLLTFLVISVWGFFIFSVFVLVKYKVSEK